MCSTTACRCRTRATRHACGPPSPTLLRGMRTSRGTPASRNRRSTACAGWATRSPAARRSASGPPARQESTPRPSPSSAPPTDDRSPIQQLSSFHDLSGGGGASGGRPIHLSRDPQLLSATLNYSRSGRTHALVTIRFLTLTATSVASVATSCDNLKPMYAQTYVLVYVIGV